MISNVALGEYICNLIAGVDISNNHIFVNHLLSNKMIINFNMLCSCIEIELEAKDIALRLSHQNIGGEDK